MKKAIKKETAKRLHGYCHRGERYDILINRLIDFCENKKEEIAISEETLERLMFFSGNDDIDDALNDLMDSCRTLKK